MIQGFLALRKHADRVLLLVEMMQGELFKRRVAVVISGRLGLVATALHPAAGGDDAG